MKLNTLTPDQIAIVRMRYIARAQATYLHLHADLCRRVLNDYGCAVITIEEQTEQRDGIIEAAWPLPTDMRIRYGMTLLPQLTERVLMLTEQQDAGFAADALTR